MQVLINRDVNIEAFGTFPAKVEDGVHWNGFECPLFTKEVADKLMEVINTTDSHVKISMTYDESEDVYIYTEEDADSDRFELVEINGEKYYGIGAFGWTWQQADEDE